MNDRTKCARVMAALSADTSQFGMKHNEIMALAGLDSKRTSAAIGVLRNAGKLWMVGVPPHDCYYFSSQERYEQCREATEAHIARLKSGRRDRERERQREAKRAEAKRRSDMRVKPAVVAPVTIMQKQRVQWADAEAVVPEGVKVTVCPSGKDYRYSVSPHFKGEFLREWQQKRGQA